MIVLDASFLAKLVVEEEGSEEAHQLMAEWTLRGERYATVDIALAEAANAIWKHHALHGDLSLEEYKGALEDLLKLWKSITVHPSHTLIEEASTIAAKHGTTIYDALYLALAARHNATLATYDKRQAKHAVQHRIKITPLNRQQKTHG